MTDFLKYETITSVRIKTEREPQIPTLSFCAYPPFDPSTSIDQIVLKAKQERVEIKNISRIVEEFSGPAYGKCFRLNSGKNMNNETVNILTSTESGSEAGFSRFSPRDTRRLRLL